MDYAREGKGLNPYLDQQMRQQVKHFQDQQEMTNEENRRQDYQVHEQLRWMKEALSQFDTIENHATNFDCAIDGGSDGPTTTG